MKSKLEIERIPIKRNRRDMFGRGDYIETYYIIRIDGNPIEVIVSSDSYLGTKIDIFKSIIRKVLLDKLGGSDWLEEITFSTTPSSKTHTITWEEKEEIQVKKWWRKKTEYIPIRIFDERYYNIIHVDFPKQFTNIGVLGKYFNLVAPGKLTLKEEYIGKIRYVCPISDYVSYYLLGINLFEWDDIDNYVNMSIELFHIPGGYTLAINEEVSKCKSIQITRQT